MHDTHLNTSIIKCKDTRGNSELLRDMNSESRTPHTVVLCVCTRIGHVQRSNRICLEATRN